MNNNLSNELEYRQIHIYGELVYGKQLLVNAKTCNNNILDIDFVINFIKKLVLLIDMIPFGEPIAHHIDKGTKYGGITVVQIIHTTIIIHAYDISQDFYLDVFSCMPFDEQKIVDFIESYFQPSNISTQLIYRS
jgi:S-adenosylmethionine/arginine decarboxylase-like enzyme